MPACSICQHGDLAAITTALANSSVRQVAERYQISKSTLARHQQRCPTVLQAVGHAGNTAPSLEERSTPAPRNPLAQYHREAVRLREAARETKHGQSCVYLAQALAELLCKMTADDPGEW